MKISILTNPPPSSQRQRGAALLIAVLIVVLGLVTLLTFRSDRKAPELEAQHKTALALAQAKEAILGRAVINGVPTNTNQNPGALPCPDRDNDGDTDNSPPTQCLGGSITVAALPANTGRVPSKTLDIDDLRDLAGERLWYILSPEFVDQGNPINTTTMPSLRIVENGIPRNVAGIVIAPGRPLAGQDRSAPNTLTNYIEGYDATTNTLTVAPLSDTYNDRIITLTEKELFTVVTFRMARELAKKNPMYPLTATSMDTLLKPSVWTNNNWNAAIDGTVSQVTSTQIKLKFLNCGVIYTITGPSNVSRDNNHSC